MAIGKIGEEIKSAQDYIYEAETVAQNTTTTSVARQVGGTQGALELVFLADTDIVITDAKVLSLKLIGADTEDGTFDTEIELYSVTADGETTIEAGTELARFIIKPSDKMWQKAVLTNDDVAIVGTVEGYIRALHR